MPQTRVPRGFPLLSHFSSVNGYYYWLRYPLKEFLSSSKPRCRIRTLPVSVGRAVFSPRFYFRDKVHFSRAHNKGICY